MKKFLSILAAVALSGVMGITASAQNYAVRGVVVDQTGPVIGAAVMEAGTTNGGDQDRVKVEAGKSVTLDFNAGTAVVE